MDVPVGAASTERGRTPTAVVAEHSGGAAVPHYNSADKSEILPQPTSPGRNVLAWLPYGLQLASSELARKHASLHMRMLGAWSMAASRANSAHESIGGTHDVDESTLYTPEADTSVSLANRWRWLGSRLLDLGLDATTEVSSVLVATHLAVRSRIDRTRNWADAAPVALVEKANRVAHGIGHLGFGFLAGALDRTHAVSDRLDHLHMNADRMLRERQKSASHRPGQSRVLGQLLVASTQVRRFHDRWANEVDNMRSIAQSEASRHSKR